ncbi:MAG: GNAT family N-acetyltransferase [Proteobacteria bacterium]|nr:GNAT family N-acetyltransferase [Pseudomonadota bacterium]
MTRPCVREQLFILAERDGALLGLVQLVPDESAMLIENLAIHPDLQGMGLGGELLRRAEEMARSQERHTMRLYTNSRFLENIAFYARRGYTETARRELLPGSIAVFMAKQL